MACAVIFKRYGEDKAPRNSMRRQARFAAQVGANDWEDIASAVAVNVEAQGRSAVLDRRNNRVLVSCNGLAFGLSLKATDIVSSTSTVLPPLPI
jgi:hypothetical protein